VFAGDGLKSRVNRRGRSNVDLSGNVRKDEKDLSEVSFFSVSSFA